MKMKVFECLKKILNSIEKQEFEHREIEQKERSRRVKLKTILETRIKKLKLNLQLLKIMKKRLKFGNFTLKTEEIFKKSL